MILFLRCEQSLLFVSINSLFTVKYLIKVWTLFSTDNRTVVSFHTTSQQFTSIKSDELTRQGCMTPVLREFHTAQDLRSFFQMGEITVVCLVIEVIWHWGNNR